NETIEAMAEDYANALRQVQPHGPYFIGGLCAGGYVAIEMARLLRKEGIQVLPLLLIDPPLPFFFAHAVEVQIQTLPARLRKHSAKGNIDFDIEDNRRWQGAIQVAASFENALIKYRPTPYEGPVFLLANTDRLSSAGGWGTPSTLHRVFSGDLKCFEVGKSHRQILDVHNETFVSSLRYCIQAVRSGAHGAGDSASAPVDNALHVTDKTGTSLPTKENWHNTPMRASKWF
ncbi:MAG: alpha/beta hydrolase family protein, partial [Gallionellaceae bacterium]